MQSVPPRQSLAIQSYHGKENGELTYYFLFWTAWSSRFSFLIHASSTMRWVNSVVVLLLTFANAASLPNYQRKSLIQQPSEWKRIRRAYPNELVDVSIGLVQNGFTALERRLLQGRRPSLDSTSARKLTGHSLYSVTLGIRQSPFHPGDPEAATTKTRPGPRRSGMAVSVGRPEGPRCEDVSGGRLARGLRAHRMPGVSTASRVLDI